MCAYVQFHALIVYTTYLHVLLLSLFSLPACLCELFCSYCHVYILLFVWPGTWSTEISMVEEIHYCHANGAYLYTMSLKLLFMKITY